MVYVFDRRLSLPASLLEPIPNLEYWQYLDRPDVFVAYVLFYPLPEAKLILSAI